MSNISVGERRDVLVEGGSAVDAAIATLFCIGAINPQSAGIGGGFLMTIYDSSKKKAWCLDAREIAPLAATEDMFQGNSTISQRGPLIFLSIIWVKLFSNSNELNWIEF